LSLHDALPIFPRLVLGPLAGNPFPDATPAFFDAMARALSLGLDHRLSIVAPFRSMHKADVIKLGVELGVPLALTMSCNAPIGMRPCGRCNKCRERHDAFLDANVPDETDYVDLAVSVPPAVCLTTPCCGGGPRRAGPRASRSVMRAPVETGPGRRLRRDRTCDPAARDPGRSVGCSKRKQCPRRPVS